MRQGVAWLERPWRKGYSFLVAGNYLVSCRAFLYHLANFFCGTPFYSKAREDNGLKLMGDD